MNAEEIKTLVMCYWRFSRRCYLVGLEFNYKDADVIALSEKGRRVYETEVKISITDMKKERHKSKHCWATKDLWGSNISHIWANYFYFAVPASIKEQALNLCQEFYPYAGLLVVGDYEQYLKDNPKPYLNPPISEIKKPKYLGTQKITEETIFRLAKGMSNTLCNKAYELMLLKRQGVKYDGE